MNIELSLANVINFFIIATGIGVCLLSILQIAKAPIQKQIRTFFVIFLWLVITYISMYMFRMFFEGHPGRTVRIILHAVTLIEFMVSGFMTFLLVMMIILTADPDAKTKQPIRIIQIVLVVHIVILIISQFSRFYYYFDAENYYHRSGSYIISNIPPVMMLSQGFYVLIRYRERFDKRIAKAFWIYLLAPIGAVVIQAFYADIKFINIATVGAAVNMFSVIIKYLTDKYEKQKLDASRIETELAMATRIQADMLPNIFPAFPDRKEFDIYASMTPAKEVGGDFYDFFLIDDDHLGIVMADVSGKGVPAALFMMASKILVQNFATMHRNPGPALEAANNQICQSNREDMFVTVWLGILELSTGILTASNAGHEYPAMRKPNGIFELYRDKHDFVIGGIAGVKYHEYKIQMEKGSMLFVYTDGVVEATDTNNELFGTDRLIDALNSAGDDTLQSVLNYVDSTVSHFVKDSPQFDDMTMLCLRYNGK